MITYTVYKDPTDYPGKYVVRRFDGLQPDPQPTAVTDNIKQARDHIPDNMYHIERCPNDDPKIVETWI